MRIIKLVCLPLLVSCIGLIYVFSPSRTVAAEGDGFPAVLQAGFVNWAKIGGPSVVLNAWKRGGPMEHDSKVAVESGYLARLQSNIGNYQSYDTVTAKRLGQNTQILYVAINFERGAVFARFLLYRADKDWVVQNMDFSTQPEALMPWLAFEGANYNQ